MPCGERRRAGQQEKARGGKDCLLDYRRHVRSPSNVAVQWNIAIPNQLIQQILILVSFDWTD
jgi:hypothetical protein